MCEHTSILVVGNEAVAHSQGPYGELAARLPEFAGRVFIESSAPIYAGMELSSAADFDEWSDIHAGVYSGICGIVDERGVPVEWLVLSDPFYIFELDDEQQDAVLRYCTATGIPIDR